MIGFILMMKYGLKRKHPLPNEWETGVEEWRQKLNACLQVYITGSRQELLPTVNRLSQWKDVVFLSWTCPVLLRNLFGTYSVRNCFQTFLSKKPWSKTGISGFLCWIETDSMEHMVPAICSLQVSFHDRGARKWQVNFIEGYCSAFCRRACRLVWPGERGMSTSLGSLLLLWISSNGRWLS